MINTYLGGFVVTDGNSNIDEVFNKTGECPGEKTGSKPDTRDGEERHVLLVVTSELGVVTGGNRSTKKREKEGHIM